MTSTESEHDWFNEQIGSYLTSGLSDDERSRFESHAQDCADCARKLDQIRQMESTMTATFAGAIPASDFEDRVLGRLRLSVRYRRWVHPLVRRIAVAAAVGIVVAGFGYVGKEFLEHGQLPSLAMNTSRGASNLRQIGPATQMYSNENKGLFPRTRYESLAEGEKSPPSAPQNSEGKSDYGGGSMTPTNWSDWDKAAQVQANFSYLYDNKPSDRGRDGHNVRFGDGNADFVPNRFAGGQQSWFYGNAATAGERGESGIGAGDRTDNKVPADAEPKRDESRIAGNVEGVATRGTQVNGRNGVVNDARFKPSEFSLAGNASMGRVIAGDTDGDGVADVGFRQTGGVVATNGISNVVTGTGNGSHALRGSNTYVGGTVVTGDTIGSVTLGSEYRTLSEVNGGTTLAFAQVNGDAPNTQPAQRGGAVPNGAQPQPQTQPAAPVNVRRVIREGVMEFEVDSFDSAFVTLSKIVAEEGGFIAAADSDKLPNGKVRGTITLRVPPDHLDTLVLKLRALGELKSQRLGSKDISKEYTDLESELRAARAMEERLLEMIKTAKGKVSELLEAEKELGTWRTRIEKITGQLNFYNNLVSMATLSITAYEKDIRTPASASQTEEINTGVETDDVEHARAEVIKSIDEAKGRIIESELKQLEAGQLAAKVVAEVAPENAGPILDRLKQLGRIARLDIQRKQVTDPQAQPTRSPRPLGSPKLETAPTRVIISMYNLANVAPRLTTNLNLAGDDVEATYRAILKRVTDANGRVITSSLLRQDATQATGAIQFEVKASEADAVLNDIRTRGPVQVLRLNVTENPDTANVTTAKQAFTVQIIPSAQVEPREKRMLGVETSNVEGAMQTITAAAGSVGGRVLESSLTQDNTGRTIARVAIEVPLGKADQLIETAKQQGKVRTSDSAKNAQVPEGPLSRARVYITLGTGETIVSAEHGVWNTIREGLGTSMRGLMLSLQLIIIGVCLVAPWALLLWGGWKLARRGKQPAAT